MTGSSIARIRLRDGKLWFRKVKNPQALAKETCIQFHKDAAEQRASHANKLLHPGLEPHWAGRAVDSQKLQANRVAEVRNVVTQRTRAWGISHLSPMPRGLLGSSAAGAGLFMPTKLQRASSDGVLTMQNGHAQVWKTCFVRRESIADTRNLHEKL